MKIDGKTFDVRNYWQLSYALQEKVKEILQVEPHPDYGKWQHILPSNE